MDFSVQIKPDLDAVIKLEDLVRLSGQAPCENPEEHGIPAEALFGTEEPPGKNKKKKKRKATEKDPVDIDTILKNLVKEETSGTTNEPPSKRKSYDIEFKLTAVEYAETFSKKKAADRFNVDRRQIQLWCQKKDLLQQQLTSTEEGVVKKRLAGAGRSVNDWNLDFHLMTWLDKMKDEGVSISRANIQEKAKELAQSKDFKASNGWLERFLKRYSQSKLFWKNAETNPDIFADVKTENADEDCSNLEKFLTD